MTRKIIDHWLRADSENSLLYTSCLKIKELWYSFTLVLYCSFEQGNFEQQIYSKQKQTLLPHYSAINSNYITFMIQQHDVT